MDAQQTTATSTALAHVLAVDDDISVRECIADYLRDNDIRVTALGNGRDIADVMQREIVGRFDSFEFHKNLERNIRASELIERA